MKKLIVAAAAACAAYGASATIVEWEFPRPGSCHEGIAFGDGRTGVLVWGGGEEIRLTVGRSDMWDHRGGYPWTDAQSYTNIVDAHAKNDERRLYSLFAKTTPPGEPVNPAMLPLGRVVVRTPGRSLARGSLDTSTGTGELVFSDGSVAALAMSGEDGGAFAVKFPEGAAFETRSAPATDFAVYENSLKPTGFEKAKVFDGARPGEGGFSWNLPADEPVWLAWSARGGALALRTGRGALPDDLSFPAYETVAGESRRHWAKFWDEGARVKVPDPAIQRVFDYGMYKFGAMTDPRGFPAGLQGPWLEDDRRVPWNGDYHFNINVQECYSPAYRGGHFANLAPLFRMVLSWRPLLRENARRFAGIDDGYVLPHSVDDRGTCIGGFWTGTIDHASTAWVASMMYRYVKYSGDDAFLRGDAYDFMRGAMNVYLAMMEERDGRLSLPLGPSPEWGGASFRDAVGRDPSFQLAAAHRLARDLLSAAARLGETPDPRWTDIEKRLPPYTPGPGGIQIFEGQPFTVSHRHHSHMAGMYPFDTIAAPDGANPGIVRETYETWVSKGTRYWTGWCVPWASILHVHAGNAAAAAEALHSWETYFNNPGHGSLHDAFRPGFTEMTGRPEIMQMDGQCAAATAVMEMMVHETGGTPAFFRGCPESWKEVSFENIALSDGRRADGRRIDGKIEITYR